MTARRYAHTRATPAIENRRWETPPPPCTEIDENGDLNAFKFDAVLDQTTGIKYWRAVDAARLVCDTCPLATKARCLVEYRDEPGVIAGLTHDERVKPKAPTRRSGCGKPHGRSAHRRAGEATCDDCRAADVAATREWRRARNDEIQHGTDTGYSRHRKAGEEACEPCLVAHRLMGRIRAKRRGDKRRDAAA